MLVQVEQAFGILQRPCGIIWNPLRYNINRANLLCHAAMKLHKFVNYNGASVSKRRRSLAEWRIAREKLDEWLEWYKGEEDAFSWIPYEVEEMSYKARKAEENKKVRRKLVSIVRRLGLLRSKINKRRNCLQNQWILLSHDRKQAVKV